MGRACLISRLLSTHREAAAGHQEEQARKRVDAALKAT
jgi:hypothetical protein